MAPLDRSSRNMRNDRCRSSWVAVIGVAIACLQSGSSFLTTPPRSPFMLSHQHPEKSARLELRPTSTTAAVTTTTRAAAARRSRQLTTTVLAAAPSSQFQQAPSVTEAVQSIFLESLVAKEDIRKPVRSLAAAKNELLELAGYGITHPGAERPASVEQRLGYLLEVLEGNYTPIQTVGFFNFAAKGDWSLAYTNAAMLPIGPRLTVKEQFQRVEPGDGIKGTFKNVISWRLDQYLDGRMEVDCAYEFDLRGRMNASTVQHRILPDGKMPSDPEGLVTILQRAMPHEMFNPDDHAMSTVFLDDTMRVVRLSGPKFEGRVNIFVRRVDSSALEARTKSESESGAPLDKS